MDEAEYRAFQRRNRRKLFFRRLTPRWWRIRRAQQAARRADLVWLKLRVTHQETLHRLLKKELRRQGIVG